MNPSDYTPRDLVFYAGMFTGIGIGVVSARQVHLPVSSSLLIQLFQLGCGIALGVVLGNVALKLYDKRGGRSLD